VTRRVAVVVGNPKPASRTRLTAELVAEAATGTAPEVVVDLADWGPALLDWKDPSVNAVVEEIGASGVVVFASPTFKSTYTGLLKLFLDRIPADGLAGVVAVPLMLGAGQGHALAPELSLRPVLTELGATVPTRGLYVLDSAHDDPSAWAGWLDSARPQIASSLSSLTGAR